MQKNHHPDVRVTCLMPTLAVPGRFDYARKSIEAYCGQTHPKRDLLIVANGGDDAGHRILHEYAVSLGRADIHVVSAPPGLNLGQLRNYTIAQAKGDVVCQWDDDDLCHPRRIERQLASLLKHDYEAVYLQEVMQYFPASGAMYWTNWRATEATGHPGTLMMRRGVPVEYPIKGETSTLGEDLTVALALIARGRVGFLAGEPYLYVYVSHGSNTWHHEHHRMLANELSLSQALLRRREPQIREGLAPYRFTAGEVTLTGSNGAAFVL
jgi:glycosyltransferase involved in cell wall biosynthesis